MLIFVPKIVNLIFWGVSNKRKVKSKTRIFVRFEQTFDEFLVRKLDFFHIYSTNMEKIVFSIFFIIEFSHGFCSDIFEFSIFGYILKSCSKHRTSREKNGHVLMMFGQKTANFYLIFDLFEFSIFD